MNERRPSPVPREARPYQGRRAGLVTRMAAAVIDAGVVGVVLLVAYLARAGLAFMVDPLGFRFPDPAVLLSLTWAFVVLVVYLTAAWSLSGRTYGDHVMGVRVVGRGGRPLRLPGAFLRALLCAVFPIGLLWCAGSREHRSVQDVLLRTSVVYDWQPRATNALAAGG
ncbi:MAG: RDD family protein [Nocardioidaceae bacterium]